nr:unnamed protein product [Spirometra erinaceieuropaei]
MLPVYLSVKERKRREQTYGKRMLTVITKVGGDMQALASDLEALLKPKSIVPPPASSSSSLPPTNSDTPSAPPLPSSSFSSTAPAVAVQAAVSHIANHDTATATTPTCPHCDRTFTSHNGLVGHLRIHRTETGEPVPGAPTYTHRTRLHCPQCPRTFRHRMGLFGHMRIHESGIDRSLDTPTPPSPTPNPSPCAPNNHSPADIDATDLTTPHSPPSSSTATTTATPAFVAHDFTTAAPDTTTGTTPATSINRCWSNTVEILKGGPQAASLVSFTSSVLASVRSGIAINEPSRWLLVVDLHEVAAPAQLLLPKTSAM